MARDRLLGELRVDLGLLERFRSGGSAARSEDDAADAGQTSRDEPRQPDGDLGTVGDGPGVRDDGTVRVEGDSADDAASADAHPLDAVATRTVNGEPVAGSAADADGAAGERPATDGGEWTGDDPISFDEDDQDAKSLLDAVTFAPEPDDAASDDGTSIPDGDGSAVDESAVDGSAATDVEAPPADEASTAGEQSDADARADEPRARSEEPARGADDPDRSGDVDELEDRVASMESQQAAVAANVEALESDVHGLHGELRTVRSDLETLVGLVKEAAPTRGASSASAAEPAVQSDDAQPAAGDPVVDDATANEPDSDGATTASEPDSHDATESEETEPVATADPGEQRASAATDEGTAENVAARAAETVEQTASRASDDRSVADPRSDAAEDRLRSFREQFEDGPQRSIEHDGDEQPAAEAFEFTKVLYPADDDDAAPEVVGDDMEKPYLAALPEGFAAEAAVIEWLDGIVSRTDEETTVQAVEFYASIGWITPSVRDTLVGYVEGVGDVEPASGPTAPPADLGLEDHRRSLEYVTRLATGEVSADGL